MHSLETSCSVKQGSKQGSKNTSSCIFEGCLNCTICPEWRWSGAPSPGKLVGESLVCLPWRGWSGVPTPGEVVGESLVCHPWSGGPSQHTLYSQPTLHAQQAQVYFLVAYPTPPQRFPAFGAGHGICLRKADVGRVWCASLEARVWCALPSTGACLLASYLGSSHGQGMLTGV